MDIQACFNDIQAVIAGELVAARHSIVAAVAWLTDPHLTGAVASGGATGLHGALE